MNASKDNYDLFPCPCCGSKVLTIEGDYELCDVCGWEDDPVQSADPNYAGGANTLSLKQFRKKWVDRLSEK